MKRMGLVVLAIVLVLGMVGMAQAARYVNNHDGTISDTQTCLMWERSSSVRPKYWKSAMTYCEGRTTGGYNDWRLPGVDELANALVYETYPATDPVLKIEGAHWSSTTFIPFPKYKYRWLVDFSEGQVFRESQHWQRHIRCVRGESWPFDPSERLELNTENTVKDTYFNLIWQKSNDGVKYSRPQARQYCRDLELDGYTNWRLPSTHELQTIIDYTRYKPALPKEILESYPEKGSSVYWTSDINPWTKILLRRPSGKYVSFGDGRIFGALVDEIFPFLVRCVQNGP